MIKNIHPSLNTSGRMKVWAPLILPSNFPSAFKHRAQIFSVRAVMDGRDEITPLAATRASQIKHRGEMRVEERP